jgi:hypothetical protein
LEGHVLNLVLRPRRLVTGFVVGLLSGTFTGCGADFEPSERVSALYVYVFTEEWERDRSIMLVGENGSAHVETETRDNCVLEPVPCPNSADVEIRSSAPDVISAARQRVRSPADVALVANGPGTATLTATADGFTKSRRIDVVSAPLPLNAIRVTLAPGIDLPAQYDLLGSLTALEAPAGETVELHLMALRGQPELIVSGLIVQISSSAPGIVSVTGDCSPSSTPCEVKERAWIMGVSAGDAEITVSARNVTTGFTVHVVEAP